MSKKKKGKKRKTIIGFYIGPFIFGLLILAFAFGAFSYMFCNLKDIEVKNSNIYTEDQVKAVLMKDKYSSNTMYMFIKNKIKPHEDISFIETIDVEINSPTKLTFTVKEKFLMAYIMMDDGRYVYFDDNGTIQEVSKVYIDGVLPVTGISVKDPKVGETIGIKKKYLKFLLNVVKQLEKIEVNPNAIYFGEDGNCYATTDTYIICIGDSEYLEDKIRRLPYIMPSIEGQSGILHLEDFSPENADIVFEKMELSL